MQDMMNGLMVTTTVQCLELMKMLVPSPAMPSSSLLLAVIVLEDIVNISHNHKLLQRTCCQGRPIQ